MVNLLEEGDKLQKMQKKRLSMSQYLGVGNSLFTNSTMVLSDHLF